jgi:hypothetical protein
LVHAHDMKVLSGGCAWASNVVPSSFDGNQVVPARIDANRVREQLAKLFDRRRFIVFACTCHVRDRIELAEAFAPAAGVKQAK